MVYNFITPDLLESQSKLTRGTIFNFYMMIATSFLDDFWWRIWWTMIECRLLTFQSHYKILLWRTLVNISDTLMKCSKYSEYLGIYWASLNEIFHSLGANGFNRKTLRGHLNFSIQTNQARHDSSFHYQVIRSPSFLLFVHRASLIHSLKPKWSDLIQKYLLFTVQYYRTYCSHYTISGALFVCSHCARSPFGFVYQFIVFVESFGPFICCL